MITHDPDFQDLIKNFNSDHSLELRMILLKYYLFDIIGIYCDIGMYF